jgi:hypothetical protein
VVLSRHVPCRRTLTSRYDLSSPCTAMAMIPITNYRHVLHIIDMDFYFQHSLYDWGVSGCSTHVLLGSPS